MSKNRPLSLEVTYQEEEPGYCKCYLAAPDSGRLLPISEPEAAAMAELIRVASGKNGAILVWFTASDPRYDPILSTAEPLETEDAEAGESPGRTYGLFRRSGSELALRDVWNNYDNLRVIPSGSGSREEIVDLLAAEKTASSYSQRVGLDWGNRLDMRQRSGCLAIVFGLLGTVRFALRLKHSRSFREKLMDPFMNQDTMRRVARYGATASKGGHDEVVTFELMTANSDIGAEAGELFQRHGISLQVDRFSREHHWQTAEERRHTEAAE